MTLLSRLPILSFVLVGGLFVSLGFGLAVSTPFIAPNPPSEDRLAFPYRTTEGTEFAFPASIPRQWLGSMAYSPDGTRIAVGAVGKIWIWDLTSADACELTAAPSDERWSCTYSHRLYWADNQQIIACEERYDLQEVADRERDGAGLPDVSARTLMLIDTSTGDRTAVNWRSELWLAGVANADSWYVQTADGRFHLYDAAAGALVQDFEFYATPASHGARQLSYGGPWFESFVPGAEAAHIGQLVVFNVATSESHVLENFRRRAYVISPDGRYLITTGFASDSTAVTQVFDLDLGVQLPTPAGEQWIPGLISGARNTLLIRIPRPVDSPLIYREDYAEISLDAVIQP